MGTDKTRQGLLSEDLRTWAKHIQDLKPHRLESLAKRAEELEAMVAKIEETPVVTHMNIEPGASNETKAAVAEVVKAAYSYKAPKVLTDEHYRLIADRMIEEHRKYGDRLRPGHWADVAARKVASHLADFGYPAPAAGLTVESITLVGEQPDPAGDIKVMVELSDGTEVEAIRTCANSIYHMVTVAGIIQERARLTAAIEAKRKA